MELTVEKISTQWSEARHLRLGAHLSDGTVGTEYQRIPGIQLLGEHDLHILVAESVADSTIPALVGVSAQFAGP